MSAHKYTLDEQIRVFWSNVDKTSDSNGCWIWTKRRLWNNKRQIYTYGQFWRNGKNQTAHRVAWELSNGAIPDGLFVLHSCDNPPCCNPAHLFLGTQKDNIQDRERKGRGNHQTGDKVSNPGEANGRARLTSEQVLSIRQRYANGGESHRTLAKEFGVSRGTIRFIVTGRNWKHI